MTDQTLPVTKQEELSITYRPLSELLGWRWENNPKLHDDALIETSIRRYGFNDPVGVDAEHKFVSAGHGRLEFLARLKALYEAGHTDGFLPENIAARDGDWLVPTVTLVFKSREEAMMYALVHNRSNVSGLYASDYDAKKMKAALAKAQEAGQISLLSGIGFGAKDFQAGGFKAEFTKPFELSAPPTWDDPRAAVTPGASSAGAQAASAEPLTPDSHIGMVHLFLNKDTRALFIKRCEKIGRALNLADVTAVVWALVEREYNALQVASQPLPGQVGFDGVVVSDTPPAEVIPLNVQGLAPAASQPVDVIRPPASPYIDKAKSVVISTPIMTSWDTPEAVVPLEAPKEKAEKASASGPEWKGGLCAKCGGSGYTGMAINLQTKSQEKIMCERCEGFGDKESYDKARTPAQASML